MARAVRRVVAALVVALCVSGTSTPAVAQTDDDAAERAAAEIAAARERANQAAEDFFAAESRLELLQLEQERLQVEFVELADVVAELKRSVEFVAVGRFVASGASGIPILTDLREPTEQLHGDVLARVVAESGATTLDDYDAARELLRQKREELDVKEAEIETSKEDLLELQADAEAEVVRLREIESQRLDDEAVAAALAARQAEDARQLEELQRRQAEMARVAATVAGESGLVVSASSSVGSSTGRVGASGGEAGGRTGGGGAGTNPRAAGIGYLDAIICPVLGGSAYGDTWGAPRSGGRRHQGTDMLAPTGTPLQAVISGWVTQGNNRLGGVTLSLQGDNGNRYYYAHLSAYEGINGRVEQGQVIGYVGDTGNATGVPHLHFEIRPGGGVPVNPYPSVRAAGC
jgi:murein DD-endopeptidase MepM/ murein hydrolase activator NlpD